MKPLILIIAFSFPMISLGQSKSDLIGTWQIENVINNTASTVDQCLESAKNYTLTFYADNTYSFNAGRGYITSGNWELIGDTINFYNSKLSDPKLGTVGDRADPFQINKDGMLIIDEFRCSELGGKTYYKKI